MKIIKVGQKLYLGVIGIFVLFSIIFILFQQRRERMYKNQLIDIRLQDYNVRMNEILQQLNSKDPASIQQYVKTHAMPHLRVTVINRQGKVLYDNIAADYMHLPNHRDRQEVQDALTHGSGTTVERTSVTQHRNYFYSATYFPSTQLIIRSALPYDDDLAKALQADQHYLWFAFVTMLLLTLVLYRFIHLLTRHIAYLRTFAERADRNESLETEELIHFSNDELGEIAERIIKIYKRLQSTRQEQDILKRQLTQNIAHELKTPVAGISGYLETIMAHPKMDDATRERFLERCLMLSRRLSTLLRDISTLNSLDDGSHLLDFEMLDIATIIRSIAGETALARAEKQMTYHENIPSTIPLFANASMVYSIFRNLTDNAIAYSGIGTAIYISAEEHEKEWKFTFEDSGVGVERKHLSRLFERFYRVDKGRSRLAGGTGLGLAIVKNAVILHHGTITASISEHGGLRFDFSLDKLNRTNPKLSS